MHAVKNGLTALLADDDPNDLILLRRAADRVSVLDRLVTVPNGADALAYLQGSGKYSDRERHPFPDVLFLDYRMPGLSGLAVLCWLRSDSRFERLPVVVLSGTFSLAQSEMANRLSAASCPKLVASSRMADLILESVRSAFRLVGQSISLGRAGEENRAASQSSCE